MSFKKNQEKSRRKIQREEYEENKNRKIRHKKSLSD
jgi:hypothetical protein